MNAPVKNWQHALIKASHVRLMIFDVDGVLTDGRLYYTETGETLKVFHVHDGHGIKQLRQVGILTAVISGRESRALNRRLQELKIDYCYMGCGSDKTEAFSDLLKKANMPASVCGIIGDDDPDLALIKQSGFSAAPPQARSTVLQTVDWITQAGAGAGAAREVCDLILQSRSISSTENAH